VITREQRKSFVVYSFGGLRRKAEAFFLVSSHRRRVLRNPIDASTIEFSTIKLSTPAADIGYEWSEPLINCKEVPRDA
jgi:hypothetical protein